LRCAPYTLHIASFFQEIPKVQNLRTGNSYHKQCFQDDPPHELSKGFFDNLSVLSFPISHVLVVVDKIRQGTTKVRCRRQISVVLCVDLLVFVLCFDGVSKANGAGLSVVGSSRGCCSSPSSRDQSVLQTEIDFLIRFEIDPKGTFRSPSSRSKQNVFFLRVNDNDAEGFGTEAVVQVIVVSGEYSTGSPRGPDDETFFVFCGNRYNVRGVDDMSEMYEDARNYSKVDHQAGGRCYPAAAAAAG